MSNEQSADDTWTVAHCKESRDQCYRLAAKHSERNQPEIAADLAALAMKLPNSLDNFWAALSKALGSESYTASYSIHAIQRVVRDQAVLGEQSTKIEANKARGKDR